MLMRKSNEILTAMNLLLLKGGVVLAESNAKSSLISLDDDDCLPLDRQDSAVHIDHSLFRELVAMAVGNICSVIQSHWEKETLDIETSVGSAMADSSPKSDSSGSSTNRFDRFTSRSKVVVEQIPSGGRSKHLDGRAPSFGNAQSLTRCVESVLCIITMLIKPPSLEESDFSINPLPHFFSKTAVLCCQAVCCLTQVSPLKQVVVEKRGRDEGILDLLVSWVNICADVVSTSKNEMGSLRAIEFGDLHSMPLEHRNPLLFELIESVACAISNLCKIDRRSQLFAGHSDFDMLGTSEYAVGVIDAQMKAVSVPAAIVKFVKAVTPDAFSEPRMGEHFPIPAVKDRGESMESITSRNSLTSSNNEREYSCDDKMSILLPFPIEVPSWCSTALMQSTLVHFAEALSSMTCRQTNRAPIITSALCSIMVTAAAQTTRHRRTRLNLEHPTEEYGPEKLQQMRQRELEEDAHLGKCALACLNGLCSFVSDALNAVSPLLPSGMSRESQKKKQRGEEALPEVVREIVSFNVLDTLKLVATLQICEARLSAFRLLSMVSDWPLALEKMVNLNITEILVSFVKDVEDANEWYIKPSSGPMAPSPTGVERLVPSKPKKERGISTDTVKSSYSEDAPSAISGSAPLALEELMRVLYFISQVCEHSFQNAARLYDEGLMRVMLNLIKHNKTNVEVHRQALRSISAMCPVLSSITPGGHPAQVIEKLTSAKDNAEMHMVQNSGKNIERRESAKMRLEFNLLIFVEALRALAHALLSPSTLVQKEALRGISLLAVDDQLRVGIVEGPLKQVIRIFVEPSTEQDIKDLAEQVFVNIGFHNGSKDLEIVANDSELLSDWFYMKRSMRPQALAYDLTRHWIDALFYGDVMAERRARKQFMLAELGHVSNHISDEADSLSIRLPGGLAIDLRDTLDLPGLDVLKGMLEKLVSLQLSEVRPSGGLYLKSTVGSSAGHSELRDALHQQFVFLFDSWQMLNQMYFADHMASEHHVQSSASMLHSPYYDMLPAAVSRQKSSPSANLLGNGQAKKKKYGVSLFSDTFFRYINHCSSKLSAQKIIADEENERLERELEAERALMGPLSAISSDIAFNSPSFHATKGVLIHTPTKNPEVRPIRKRQTSNVGVMDGAENLVQLHEPLAARVVELFDFIFPSKMLQLYLLDLVSCGLSFRNGDEDFSTPSPRQFRALLLPPREYPTFHREGRIIERIFDDIRTRGYQSEKPTFNYAANVLSFGSDTSNSSMGGGTYKNTSYQPNAVLWAVCFRDSKFENEFFGTFSNTLHKCPSIAILNFVMQTPKMDSRLGYLAGNVPPTIRFLVFENALSSDSLQIMCVLLRTQNAAWQKGGIDNSARISKSTSRNRKDSNPAADRGLYGLTIRLHNLSDDDIQLIVELLDPSGESNKSAGLPSDFSIYKSPAQISKSVAIPTVTATVIKDGTTQANEPAAFPTNDDGYPMNTRGLKYLDLSDNRLSDAQCGDVLKAAAFGPLEGLELGGNLIQRGLYFSDSLLLSLSHPHNVLKHLGVSFCGLSQKCFVKILQCIAHALNPSLTSLDCSSNSLIHSAEVKEAIHDLLKKNRTLRIIDLSRNSFSNDTIRAINLGLLENESTVLILEISLNSTMKAQELAYVREKLWRNRELYAAQRAAANSCYRHSSMDGGHHDTSSLDFGADLMRERNTMDLSDVVPHSFSAIQISRESSVSSTLSAGVAAGDSLLSPVRRSVSGVLPNMSRTSSKDSSSAEVTPSSVSKLGPKLPSDSILNRSVSNPFITISDFGGRRRSGTGVSSRQEALDAVSRFAEDGSKLNVDLNGIAFRSANGDLAPSFDGILEPYDPTAVQAVRVENAYPVTSVVDAMVMPEEAIVLGTDNETADTDDKDGLMESMMGQKHADDVVSKSTRSMFSEVSYPDGISRELWVLFSAPLAWRDAETGVLRPIEMLNYKNEKDTLWQVFREGQRDIDLHFNFATTDQLRTAVTLGCKALHFSGHGHPEWLNFEDGRSGLQIVTVDRLEKLCSAGGIKLDFVFVSACYSRKAGEAFAAAGVKHVVCVSVDAQLLDTAATIFTRAFYLALVVGENVDKAFEIGQNAVAASPSVPSSMKEHDKFLLLPQDKPHNVPIFRAPSLPSWPPENSAAMRWEDRLTPDYLPEPPEDFEGREVDMYEVITALHKRHLVSIIGERGLGKSAVAVASMRYLTERNVFEHGAVYVRLQQVTTYAGFLTTFQRILTTTCPAAAEKLHQLSSANRVDDSGGASGDTSAYRYKRDPLFTQEDLLISCVSSLKLLIVFDHANNVLTTGEVGSDVTMFLGNLLEGRRNIRVFNSS